MPQIEFFHQGPFLRAYRPQAGVCHLDVRPVRLLPVTRPSEFLSLLNAKGQEIALLTRPQDELSPESWSAVQLELRRRDFSARIEALESIWEDNGVAYFTARTNRGQRDFLVTSLETNAIFLGVTQLVEVAKGLIF